MDTDYEFAISLHSQLNYETVKSFNKRTPCDDSEDEEDLLSRTQNLVHPALEVVDPTPNVHSLFVRFNQRFFESRLDAVMVEWSKRMMSCAGICYLQKTGIQKVITIRLSEPLLKLRTRKDLIETLLHEMIHAYCFMKNIREGNGGHGPNFKRIMHAINQIAGTNITVYHSFHDEVNLYKQHWWRCKGACRERSPYYGFVKRSCNRKPGPNDFWWAEHSRTCGGVFEKIKEPEPKAKNSKASGKSKKTDSVDLRKYFPTTSGKNVGNSTTMNVNPSLSNKLPKAVIHTGNKKINTISTKDCPDAAKSPSPSWVGSTNEVGRRVGSVGGTLERNHLRDLWAKRFAIPESSNFTSNIRNWPNESELRPKKSVVNDSKTSAPVIIEITDSDEDTQTIPQRSESHKAVDLTQSIKEDIMQDNEGLTDEDIIFIDDEFDDRWVEHDKSNTEDIPPQNKSITELANWLKDSNKISECPICMIQMKRADLDDHFEVCTGVFDESTENILFGQDLFKHEDSFSEGNPSESNGIEDIRNWLKDSDKISECPICMEKMKRSELEDHFQICTGFFDESSTTEGVLFGQDLFNQSID